MQGGHRAPLDRYGAQSHSDSERRGHRGSKDRTPKLDAKFVEDLARKLAANVPGSVRALQADLERNFEALLGSTFEKLQLVTREEFDVQRRVLERTREKLTRVEAELEALEDRAGSEDRRDRAGRLRCASPPP